jgi:hypothetical protein
MPNQKQAEKESWYFLIDLGQLPYNQKASPTVMNLEVTRQIEAINESINWCLDRASGRSHNFFLLIVNSIEDANKIRGMTLKFNARNGRPFEIKLEEQTFRQDRDDADWNPGIWVKIYGTFSHTYERGSREVALNMEPDENFDTVFRSFGKILRPTKVNFFMVDKVDDEGRVKKVSRTKDGFQEPEDAFS